MFVRQDEPESKVTDFGLIVPEDDEQEQKASGVVLAVGDEVKGIKKGDHVIYGAYAGEKMKMKEGNKEVDFLLVHDEDVIAFIEE